MLWQHNPWAVGIYVVGWLLLGNMLSEATGNRDLMLAFMVSAGTMADVRFIKGAPKRNPFIWTETMRTLAAVLCFGIGVALAIGAANQFMSEVNNPYATSLAWFPGMLAAMFLLGSFLLLRRKPSQ
jgi:uncharacterized membrane protein YdcZ (DUF606 family)